MVWPAPIISYIEFFIMKDCTLWPKISSVCTLWTRAMPNGRINESEFSARRLQLVHVHWELRARTSAGENSCSSTEDVSSLSLHQLRMWPWVCKKIEPVGYIVRLTQPSLKQNATAVLCKYYTIKTAKGISGRQNIITWFEIWSECKLVPLHLWKMGWYILITAGS